MKKIKKPISILLSLILILSVFTIIPMSASAEDAPTVTLSKWVESTQEDQDEFSFEGLYDNFIFCRVNIHRVRRDRKYGKRHGDHDDREQKAQRFFHYHYFPPTI